MRAMSIGSSQLVGETVSKKNQYVVRAGNNWGVRGEGNARLTERFDTQQAAIERGREIARNQGSELRIQGRDAKFRESWSYGNDPFPPKG
tara:strand:- start:392 stop:661 length:270 start_codon:yes stop_codon:yes gene_type:complete